MFKVCQGIWTKRDNNTICHVRYWFHHFWPGTIKSMFNMAADEECWGPDELPVCIHSDDKWNKRIHCELRLHRSWLSLHAQSQRDWNIVASVMGCPCRGCLPWGSSRQQTLHSSGICRLCTISGKCNVKMLKIRQRWKDSQAINDRLAVPETPGTGQLDKH